MKIAIRILILSWMLMLGREIKAQTVTSNVTQILTITNVASNGFSIQINGGPLRMFTNVLASAVTNITQTNSTNATATNLFLALSVYPNSFPYVSAVMTNSNVIVLTTINGQNLTVTTNNIGSSGWTNWLVVQGFTNLLTNATGVRVPTNAVGVIEQSNVAYGLFGYLNSPFMTNTNVASYAVNSTLPQWSNFVNATSLAALSNHVGVLSTNGSNYSLTLYQTATNYTWIEATNATNFTTNFATNCYINNSNYTYNSSNYLWTLFDPLLGAINPWQTGLNVNLTNEFGKTRYYAQDNGGSIGGYSYLYESDGSTIWLESDGNGDTLMRDRLANNRFEMDGTSLGIGNTYIRGLSGQNLVNNGPAIGGGFNPTIGAGIAIGGSNGTLFSSRPVVMQNNILPAVCIGTITNFPSFQVTANTVYDSNNIPGTAMTNNGDTLKRTVGISFASGSGYSLGLSFGGQPIFATGSFNASASGGFMTIQATVTDNNGTFYYAISAAGSFLSSNTFASCGTASISGMTNFYITIANDVGTDDITVQVDNEELAPSSRWQVLP